MLDFSNLGKLQYIEEYTINTKEKLVTDFEAAMESYKNKFFKIHIKATYMKDILNYQYIVEFQDLSIKSQKYAIMLSNLTRLDTIMEIVDKLYEASKKKSISLDNPRYTWYNSTTKTEDSFIINMGDIDSHDCATQSVKLAFDKNTAVIKEYNNFSVCNSEYKDGTLYIYDDKITEVHSITSDGFICVFPKETVHVFYTEGGLKNQINFSNPYIPKNRLLADIPIFCMLYKNMSYNISDQQDIVHHVDYDEYGIYKSNSCPDEYNKPVIYEKTEYNSSPLSDGVLEINSIHPIHIDPSNYESNDSMNLYAMDSLIKSDIYNECIFSRFVRKLSDTEVSTIKSVRDSSYPGYKLKGLDFEMELAAIIQ